MAANNYYNTSYHYNTPIHPYSNDVDERSEVSLPSTYSPHQHAALDDHNYPYSHQTPSQSYTPSHSRPGDDIDPFEDGNSIPLNGHKAKHASTATVAPMLPHEMDDPFVRDAKSRRTPRQRTKQGWFVGRITWVVYFLTLVQLIVFIVEIIKNGVMTKSPIEIHPSFNPMIGPSPYVMINMGSRFVPCMHNMPDIQNRTQAEGPISWPCPNTTSLPVSYSNGTTVGTSCSLHALCGFGAKTDDPAPNQWYRFIIPIFIHAGIIHIGFNLLLQLTLGRDVEILIGSIRFVIVYFAAGIFGFVLGGNYAATGISSCGCSGSLFGILAITLIDLLYTWKDRPSPLRDLAFIGIDVAIAFVLGLLPGLDNFSHIGGFFMGLVLGVCILRSPAAFSRRMSAIDPTTSHYFNPGSTQSRRDRDDGVKGFVRAPMAFFQDRRGVWWVWWIVRLAALIFVLVAFILLLKNFYVWQGHCGWCKYLSCLDITVGGTNWCTVGNLNFTSTSSAPNGTSGTSHNPRSLAVLAAGKAFDLLRHV